MTGLRLAGLMFSLTVLVTAARPSSAQPTGEPTDRAVRRPAVQVAPKPLQGSVKLAPALVLEATGPPLPPDWEAELQAHKALRQRYENWNLNYKPYMGRVASCLSKDHTVTDQQAAGCVPSDTLAVCMDKLYNACLDHPQRKLVAPVVPELVDRARALSAEAARLADNVPNAVPRFRVIFPKHPVPMK